MRILIITPEWENLPFISQQVMFLVRKGIYIDVFQYKAKRKLQNYLKAWLKLRTHYDLNQYDLIHAHFGQSGLIALPSRKQCVVTFHGSDLQGIVGRDFRYKFSGVILRLLSKFVASHVKQVIIVSNHMVEFLPRGVDPQVIPCGVDLELFYPMDKETCRKQLCLPKTKHLILFGGRPYIPGKRLPLAMAAIGLLKTQLDIELIIMNDVPHKCVPYYINACDLMLLTSLHEGSPTIVKEALACNVPVVSVDVGDVRERIGDIKGCALCRNDSPQEIARSILAVLACGNRINSRSKIENLDEKLIAQRLFNLYGSILN